MPRERERVNEKKIGRLHDLRYKNNTAVTGRMLVYMHMYTCTHTYMYALMHTCTHTYTHNTDTRVNVLARGLANGATTLLICYAPGRAFFK